MKLISQILFRLIHFDATADATDVSSLLRGGFLHFSIADAISSLTHAYARHASMRATQHGFRLPTRAAAAYIHDAEARWPALSGIFYSSHCL